MSYWVYQLMKIATALLITGTLSRVLFDLNILYLDKSSSFNAVEALIALSRNLGLGGVLVYLTYIKKYD